jgi:hypothetical protein
MGHEQAHEAVLRAARQTHSDEISFSAALEQHGILREEVETGSNPASYLGWSADVAHELARSARFRST